MFVHIVLVKVKQQVLANGFEEFKARLETLRDIKATKEEAIQVTWGPPLWEGRTHGYNYGLYSVFRTREGLERYKEDPEHKEYVPMDSAPDANCASFIKMNMIPNVDGASRARPPRSTDPVRYGAIPWYRCARLRLRDCLASIAPSRWPQPLCPVGAEQITCASATRPRRDWTAVYAWARIGTARVKSPTRLEEAVHSE